MDEVYAGSSSFGAQHADGQEGIEPVLDWLAVNS